MRKKKINESDVLRVIKKLTKKRKNKGKEYYEYPTPNDLADVLKVDRKTVVPYLTEMHNQGIIAKLPKQGNIVLL